MVKRIYTFVGRDTWSDSGQFEIIVAAETRPEARRIAEEHLQQVERADLISKMRFKIVQSIRENTVISSSWSQSNPG